MTSQEKALRFEDLPTFNIVTTNRLKRAGFEYLSEVYELGYRGLIASNAIGNTAIWQIIMEIDKAGWARWPEAPYSINGVQHDLQTYRRKHNLPLIQASSAENLKGNRPQQQRARRVQPEDSSRDYVEIIVRRGFRCRSCAKVTEVGEAETPMGFQMEGFTWHDSVQTGQVAPYFICIVCAQDVEVVGKLALELMGS